MAKIALGEVFHVGHHRDAVTGELSTIVRSAHNIGGNRAFRRCVADRMRGEHGDARAIRAKFQAAAEACRGVGDRGRRRD